ncbi:diguanylate cyclase (GGDEF) domain-containing protein [Paenibacillus sp. UNCCL117]|uniref:ATP-binding protein n=1 Tax=unclassified Paenibacillus TaxID=185978 RepID=UPI000890B47F|nr:MULTISPECIES: ATP-binding protein [unclassified Paenibacillus]SDC77988.1 diguanylate cyclase (GGDEF) domain-containing protein [Paenibacillus sp. cl123]SFW25952.1 diguanylate cyclase (GGDEF) domain-containing protein [Paenibacillus sp. UNCCL117]
MKGHSIFLIYCALVGVWSLVNDSALNTPLLAAAALLYMISLLVPRSIPGYYVAPVILLMPFHAVSASDWCLPLYLLHMGQLYRVMPKLRTAAIWSALLSAAYLILSLTYHPPNISMLVQQMFASASCFIIAFMFGKLLEDVERQKQLLAHEKKHLSTHDPLTGLYNFQEFHLRMEKIVAERKPIVLVLADCKDLKSLNTTNGFQGVNDILKQAAQLLRIMFPESSLISRYGGDEFAIVMESQNTKQTLGTITQLLAAEFPKLTGIEINFGTACFPEDGQTKDDLMSTAEHRLYIMKRDSWMKREEHMLRSEKLRVVGELASGMAHEIRNPLTTVKGFLQLSRAGNYNIKPWYEFIMDEINRMSMLTAEFLQFSKPHVTQYRIQSIHSCINRVISLLEPEATRLGHKIQFIHDNQDIRMLMDQDKMLQLLLNLSKNALEAMTEQGFIDIHLNGQNGKAVIEICDTGKGIPEAELDKIFIPFYTTKDSGTGLGLSICHKIVQDHEGTIEVESFIGSGTKFTITMPAVSIDRGHETGIKEERTTISV